MVDTIPPVITATGPSDVQTSSPVTLWAKTNEPARCQYSTSASFTYGSGIGTVTDFDVNGTYHSKSTTGWTEGIKTRYVSCQDLAGNNMTTNEKLEFVYDTGTLPIINGCSLNTNIISYYPPNIINANVNCYEISDPTGIKKATAQIIDSNNNMVVEFELSGTAGTIYANSIGVDGVYTVKIKAIDNAENSDTYTAGSLTVDGTPPETIVALDHTTVSTVPGIPTTTTVRAVIRDIISNVVYAEFHVGPANARTDIAQRCSDSPTMYNSNGSFITSNTYALNPEDGAFDSKFEEVNRTVNGDFSAKCIFVHAKDAAGNWEQTKAVYLTQTGKAVWMGEVQSQAPATAVTTPLTGFISLTATNLEFILLILITMAVLVPVTVMFIRKK